MENFSRILFTIETNSKEVLTDLEALKSKYGGIISEQQKQGGIIGQLREKEAALRKERELSNDPKRIQAINSELKKTEGQLTKLTQVSKGWGSQLQDLGTSIAGFGLAMLGLQGLSSISGFFKEAIDKAVQFEATANRLKFAVNEDEGAYRRLMDVNKELAGKTLFGRSELLEAQTYALQLGRTEEQTNKMIQAAMGLSRVTGQNLNSSMMQLSMTLEGMKGRIAKYAGEINKMSLEQLKNGDAIDVLSKKLGKFAYEGLDTAEGKLIIFQKTWGAFSKNLGIIVLPVLTGFLNMAGKFAKGMATFMAPPETAETKWRSALEKFVNFSEMVPKLSNRYDELKAKTKLSNDEQEEMKSIIQKVSEQMPRAVNEWDKYGNAIGLSTTKMQEYIDTAKNRLKIDNMAAIKESKDSLEDINTKIVHTRMLYARTIKTEKQSLENVRNSGGLYTPEQKAAQLKALKEQYDTERYNLQMQLNDLLGLRKGYEDKLSEITGDAISQEIKRRADEKAKADALRNAVASNPLIEYQKQIDRLSDQLKDADISPITVQKLLKEKKGWEDKLKWITDYAGEYIRTLDEMQKAEIEKDRSNLTAGGDVSGAKKLADKEYEYAKTLADKKLRLGKMTQKAYEIEILGLVKKWGDAYKKIAEDNEASKKRIYEEDKQFIENQKAFSDIAIELMELQTETGEKNFKERIKAAKEYYNTLISLEVKNGNQQAAEDLIMKKKLEIGKLIDEERKFKKEKQKIIFSTNKEIEAEQERHYLEMMKLSGASESAILRQERDFAKKRLSILNSVGASQTKSAIELKNKISELNKQIGAATESEMVQWIESIAGLGNAAIEVLQKINAASLQGIESNLNFEQTKIEKLESILDKQGRYYEQGNVKMLQLEKKKYDDLNKEKQKYLRIQQGLAMAELVMNSVVAISKAAAQGGIAAPFTIAATLLALVGGFIAARQEAESQTFFKGGYTGDGNPRQESKALGKKSYIYHKKEFVFPDRITKDYRPVFEDILSGKLNLSDKLAKASILESVLHNSLDRDSTHPKQNIFRNMQDNAGIENRLDRIEEAVKRDKISVTLDQEGFQVGRERLLKIRETRNKTSKV